MCVWGTENMLFYDGDVDRLRPLAEAEDEEGSTVRRAWLEESTLVFEGDYSCPEVDKPHLVDLVLGLYGFILRVKGSVTQQTVATDHSFVRWRSATSAVVRQQTMTRISQDRADRKTKDLRQQLASSRLHPVIIKNYQRCFPPEYFGDLPELLQNMLSTDEELKKTVSSRQSQQSEMRRMGRIKRWSVSLAQVPPILSGAAAASRRLASPRSAPSLRVVPSISHAPPPEPLEASASAASSWLSPVVPSPSIPLGPEQLASILASIPLHDLEKVTAARQSVKESVAATRSRGRAGVLELADLNDSLDKYTSPRRK